MSEVVVGRSRAGLTYAEIVLEILPAALVVLMLAAVGVVHVTSRVMVVKMGYELSRLDQQGVTLERENAQLRLELATLKSPPRLEAIARTRLGLVTPAPEAVIHAGPRPTAR